MDLPLNFYCSFSSPQTLSFWSGIATNLTFVFNISRAPAKDRFLFSRMAISSPNPMFDHSLELSHRDDSNKWSNIGFSEEFF